MKPKSTKTKPTPRARDVQQLDVFRHSDAALAAAYRKAAEIAALDPHYPRQSDREKRAAYYLAEAERIERLNQRTDREG